MTRWISLIVAFYGISAGAASAEPVETCLEQAKAWAYRNLSLSAADAARAAIDFCGDGGKSACLDPAQLWIYRATGRTPLASGQAAFAYCRKGRADCLEPARQWIYRNGGVSAADAAEQAIKVCASRGPSPR